MTTSRVQLALNVEDMEAATAFYTKLFGVAPHKQRTGYANFVVEDPPLKLVLFENPGADQRLNHLGVEVADLDEIPKADARFRAAGLETRVADGDLCCHAVQDKVFVTAPDVPNGWWEYYAIADDAPDETQPATRASVCCSGASPTDPCNAGPESRADRTLGACL